VPIHLSVTVGGLADDSTAWKPQFYCKKVLMPMWRYEIINLFREAYNRGELKLPKELQVICPTKTEFNRWLNIHYQKSWIVHFAKPGNDPRL
jgi:hypothetical protein